MPTPYGSGSKFPHGVHAGRALELENLSTAPAITTNKVYFLNGVLYADGVSCEGGGGGGSSLDAAYNGGSTISVDIGSVTLAGVNQDTAVLAITGDGDSAGALLKFTHTTDTRNDVLGTGSTWKVTGQGKATFDTVYSATLVAAASSNVNLTIDAAGSGTIAIGATSTGVVTITPALTATASITVTGAGGSNVLTVTAGDVVVSDGSLLLTDDDNASSLRITNNSATTVGASANTGLVEFASTSLTTGTLLHLELTEGTLNGGHYLKCWDVTAGAAVFSVGENGDVSITGTADATALAIASGDFVMLDGKVAITNQDNEDTLAIVNNGLTSASAIDLSGSGTFTGSTTSSFIHVSPSGLTSGTVAYIVAGALTTGKMLHMSATAATDGILLDIVGGGANMSSTGRVAKLSMGAGTVGQALEIVTTGAYTGAGVVTVTADSATTAGASAGQGIVAVSADAITTGTLLDVTSTSIVLTTGRLVDLSHISGNITGTLDKTADLINMSSERTVTTGTVADDFDMVSLVRTSIINGGGTFSATGSVLRIENAVTNTSGTVTDTAKGLEIVMDSLGTGDALEITHGAIAGISIDIVATAMTTGKAIDISDANALTSGIVLHIASSATAIATTGRLIYSNHSGATGSTAILNEFASAANDETTIFKVTASDLLAGGVAVDISAVAMTTGTALDLSDLNALTSGKGINLIANSSDTGSFILLNIKNDHASATGASLITATQDSTGDSIFIDHNGVTGKAIFIDHEGTTQTGGIIDISPAALTTGTVIDIGDADALTTGKILNLVSNSADVSARSLVYVKNDHASAVGAIPLTLAQDGAVSTNYFKMATFVSSSGTVTLWCGNGTTGNGNLSGTAGDILFNGGSNKPEYCTGTTNWTALV